MTRKKTASASNESYKIKTVEAKTENQHNYIRAIIENDIIICSGPSGCGKAQPLDSIIITPHGPVNMGDVKIHDTVCTPDGGIAKIIAIHPQGKKMIYSINFKNGHSVECCEDHLWLVERYNGKTWRQKTITTKEMLQERLLKEVHTDRGIWNRYIFRIKASSVVHFNTQEITIDPYILGVILGDGGISQNSINIISADEEVIDLINKRLPKNLKINKLNKKYNYSITKMEKSSSQIKNDYKEHLKNLNLMGKLSLDKSIPDIYKYNSLSIRLNLIRGLMDTDGYVDNNGNIEYSSSSINLAYDVKEVLESLGCIVSINKRETTHNDSYRLYIRDVQNLGLFYLNRKLNRLKNKQKGAKYHYISSISRVGIKDCQCISIDDQKHLYITNNFIPTHNSMISAGIGAEHLHADRYEQIVVTRPLICSGKDIGALPGEIGEKIAPYVMPMMEYFRMFLGNPLYTALVNEKRIRFEPLEVMRGSTFHNTYMILDEAQNCTFDQIKMFMTRIGDNSKVIINGDIKQNDLRGRSGLETCMNKLKNIEGVGIIELTNADIQRHGIIGKILNALES